MDLKLSTFFLMLLNNEKLLSSTASFGVLNNAYPAAYLKCTAPLKPPQKTA
jgi:hypothetical protein